MLKGVIFGAVLGLALGPVHADSIQALMAGIDGTEVEASGRFVIEGAPLNRFVSDGTSFYFDLAVDRETFHNVMSCPGRSMSGETCTADISAEVTLDGSNIRLVIFDVRNLVVPE